MKASKAVLIFRVRVDKTEQCWRRYQLARLNIAPTPIHNTSKQTTIYVPGI